MLRLCCCIWAFSRCGKRGCSSLWGISFSLWGLLFLAGHGLLWGLLFLVGHGLLWGPLFLAGHGLLWGLLFPAGHGLLTVVVSLVAEPCAWLHTLQEVFCTGLVALWLMGYSQTRACTCVPCIDRQILNHWDTRGVPKSHLTSLVAQLVKNPPAMRETWVRSLGWEDPLEKGKATYSSILAWRIPGTV